MADKDLELDLSVEDKPKSSKMRLIIILIVVLLLAGGGVAFFLLSGDSEEVAAASTEEKILAPIYMPLRPSFVVNFANASGKTRYLQAEVTLMGRDPLLMSQLEDHEPLVKAKLVDVFQRQEFEELKTPEGKEMLRETALEEVQMILTEELGDPVLEKIYFTVFILQ